MNNILESATCIDGKLYPTTLLQDKCKLVKVLAFGKGFHLKPHQAETDVLILILEGSACATVLGQQHEMKNMDYIVFPKGEMHELIANTDMKMLLIK